MLYKLKMLLNEMYNNRMLEKNRITFSNSDINICGRIFCKVIQDGVIILGDGLNINSGRNNNPIGGDTVCRLISYGGKLEIGKNVGISNSSIVSTEEIKIDDNVMIGGSCKIYDSDFHPLDYYERITYSDNIKSKPIHIKEGAFIGAHSIILKGSVIGKRSIIGAGSVVAGQIIPDDEIWGGNPVRFIRKIN